PRVHGHARAGGAGGSEPEGAARAGRCGPRRGRRAAVPRPAVQARPVLRRDRRHRRRHVHGPPVIARADRGRTRMTEPVTGIALAVVIVGLALTTLVTRTSFLVAGGRIKLNHTI